LSQAPVRWPTQGTPYRTNVFFSSAEFRGKKIHLFYGSATRSQYHVFSVPRRSSLNKSVPRHIPFGFGLSQGPDNGYLPVSFGDPSRTNREIMA
jgi:hypothetical protein